MLGSSQRLGISVNAHTVAVALYCIRTIHSFLLQLRTVVVVVVWPGIFVIGVSTADVYGVAPASIHTRLQCNEGRLMKDYRQVHRATHNERHPEHLQLWAELQHLLRHHALEVAVDLGHALHGAGAPHVGPRPADLNILVRNSARLAFKYFETVFENKARFKSRMRVCFKFRGVVYAFKYS